ncbi:hypothetical protein CBA19CS11_29245 [Caballeronia novacaledonica]|uniref:hypothetical protein n=1 Tax=Caballeronia novacaledonica TaxID=1544861 RepID=UPI001EE3511B|nr:hypothetical protein [Caballeronia novacaledonica]GJH13009.1 hypothetical protein CBA19CS11_29245 [Caballeronia novacaledonica]
MKKLLAALCLCLPLVAHAQGFDLGGLLGKALGTNQKELDARVLAIAKTKAEQGMPFAQACNEAIDEVGKFGTSRFIQDTCFGQTRAVASQVDSEERLARRERERAQREQEQQEAAARIAAEKKAKEDAAAAQLSFDLQEIRAGRKEVLTMDQAVAIYDAKDGNGLASKPLLRPSGKSYVVTGTIDKPTAKDASFTALANNGMVNTLRQIAYNQSGGVPRYFYVRIPKRLEDQFYERAKVGAGFNLVGAYRENIEYRTVSGESKSMPVFEAEYLEFWSLN